MSRWLCKQWSGVRDAGLDVLPSVWVNLGGRI